MFLVRVTDNEYIHSSSIKSIKTIKSTNKIKTIVYVTEGEFVVFESELKGARLGKYPVEDVIAEITAECFKEIIQSECNYKENIGTTFRIWNKDYIGVDLSEICTFHSFEEQIQPIIDDAVEKCCDDLYDTLCNE